MMSLHSMCITAKVGFEGSAYSRCESMFFEVQHFFVAILSQLTQVSDGLMLATQAVPGVSSHMVDVGIRQFGVSIGIAFTFLPCFLCSIELSTPRHETILDMTTESEQRMWPGAIATMGYGGVLSATWPQSEVELGPAGPRSTSWP